jgi:hypothetical protein
MENASQNLSSLINVHTNRRDFEHLIDETLTPAEKDKFGPHAAYVITEAFSYLGPFSDEVGSFGKDAFRFVNEGELEEKEADDVLDFLVDKGLVMKFMNERLEFLEGRFTISQEIKEMILDLENGFLNPKEE